MTEIKGTVKITGQIKEANSKRLVIKKEVLEKLNWKKGDELTYNVRGNKLILSKEE